MLAHNGVKKSSHPPIEGTCQFLLRASGSTVILFSDSWPRYRCRSISIDITNNNTLLIIINIIQTRSTRGVPVVYYESTSLIEKETIIKT